MKKSSWRLVVAAGMIFALLSAGSAFAVTHITMGTAGVGGMNYPVGMAMAKVWNAHVKDVKAVAIATAGAVQNIDMIRTQDIEVAVCRANEAYRAFNGIEKYEGKPHSWLRALTGGVMFDAKTVVALKDKGINTIADFRGKRVAVGPVGSGGELDAREILAAYGITYKDITPEYVEASQAVDMMSDGLVEGAILGFTPGASAISELMLTGKVVILPIDEAGYQALKTINPLVGKRVLKAGTYPNQDYDVETCGDPADLIITREELPEELVYQMTKALYENLEDVRSVAAAVRGFGPELVAPPEEMLIPYHDGALRYFKEAGILK
jgi:hypothetical protein